MKIVLQDGSKDCGVCSLLSIIRHYGGDVSKEYLRELTGTTKNGVSFYQLLEASKKLGFNGEGVKGEVECLDITRLPFIAHIVSGKKYQHFVVIYNINFSKKSITIMDPAKGKKIISISEFKLLSSGYFLYLSPVKTLPIFHKENKLNSFIKTIYFSRKNIFFLVSLLSFLLIICQIITAFHFQYLFDYAISVSLVRTITSLSVILVCFYLFYNFFSLLKDLLIEKFSLLFEEKLLHYVYKQILLLPYLYFKNRTLGEILERVKDVIKIKNFLLKLITSFFTDFLFLLIFFFLLFRICWQLTLILLIYFIIMFFLSFIFSFKKHKYQKKVLTRSDFIQTFFIESFQNVDTIKGLHLEYDFLKQFGIAYQKYLSKVYNLDRIVILENNLRQFFYHCMLLFFYGCCSYFVIQKKMNVTEIFISQYIFHALLGYMLSILSFVFESYQIPICTGRIRDLFTLFRENFDGSNYYQVMVIKGDIQFSNLTFAYGTKKLFKDFSVCFPFGKKIFLTGCSGSGKSSLVKMIMGYIEIPYGMLSINNIDINHFHLKLLRERISYVTGNELLFSNTLYYNITLNRNIDISKVTEVSNLVLLNSIVDNHPLKYQQIVEENGFNFSAGERQKILLARALLKDSDIYIFDEAFHQIDILQEKKILSNIFSCLKNKTVIVISHRLQHLELYELKYRLEKGKIYEFEKI